MHTGRLARAVHNSDVDLAVSAVPLILSGVPLFVVHHQPGHGCLEKAYRNAMQVEAIQRRANRATTQPTMISRSMN